MMSLNRAATEVGDGAMHRVQITGTIVSETVEDIRRIMGSDVNAVTVERVVIGLFFTGVKLSSGTAGTAATPLRGIPEAVCCPTSAMAMPFPGKLRGRPAIDLLPEVESASPIRRAVGVATMNALAEMCWNRQPDPVAELQSGVDAFDAAGIRPGDHVVVVGAFVPFLRALKQAKQPFTILEIDPRTLKPDEMRYFRPADQAPAVIPTADVVLMTGTTLLNDTLEGLLALCRPSARVAVIGPTVSLLPGAFLRRGANVLGGVRVTAPDGFLDVLAEGGSGYHFFGHFAEKVVLRRRPGEALRQAA